MSFDWSDYLIFAEALVRDPKTPGPEAAALRAAISRAYYAAFCEARSLAVNKDSARFAGDGSDHGAFAAHFRKSEDKQRKSVGTALSRLRKHRNQADYDDLLSERPDQLARLAVETARNVITILATL